jgi:hypothetical protein
MDSLIRHSFVSNFYEPARDEISFHGQRGEVLGQPEMRECNRLMTKLGGKGSVNTVEEMIGLQFAAIRDGIECSEPCLWAVHACDGHGAIPGGDG